LQWLFVTGSSVRAKVLIITTQDEASVPCYEEINRIDHNVGFGFDETGMLAG
jgi:hypothetical protein